jgi:hypothetical protein
MRWTIFLYCFISFWTVGHCNYSPNMAPTFLDCCIVFVLFAFANPPFVIRWVCLQITLQWQMHWELVSPVLDYFSSLFCREDWHIAATATPVSSLEEHKQSIAQRRIAVDGTTTSSNVNPNACDARCTWSIEWPHRSLSWISRRILWLYSTAITGGDRRDW